MKLKSFLIIVLFASMATMTLTSCQKGDFSNPNAAQPSALIPLSLIVNNITANLVLPEELPFGNGNVYKYGQYQVSNYSKYWGNNEYSWNYSDNSYQILKYAIALENQAKTTQLGTTNNKYFALAKFLRAYSAVWLSQRVGDIPMSQAGDVSNIAPVFDEQKVVYKNALALLDTANTIMAGINSNASLQGVVLDAGDIFGLTNLQWQKLFNTYKLRVLISLSKRADDNADLKIKEQFAAIVTNPTTYPIMTSTSDNMVYKFNSTNLYSNFLYGNNAYNNYQNIGKPILDITTINADPRTYLYACPASAQLAAPNNKTISDFSAYVGADPKLSLSVLSTASSTGAISNVNAIRYFTSGFVSSNTIDTYEPFVFIGYSEMCFNIAEGINRGWAPTLTATNAKTFYDNGIAASFKNLGLSTTASSSVKISDVTGKSLGTVTTDNATFLTKVVYNTGSASAALIQILQQKYVSMFMNSGYEAFFNARRTGIPQLSAGGAGTGTTTGAIPRRWLYPLSEINYNAANYKTSIGTQYGGSDDVTKDMWLIK